MSADNPASVERWRYVVAAVVVAAVLVVALLAVDAWLVGGVEGPG